MKRNALSALLAAALFLLLGSRAEAKTEKMTCTDFVMDTVFSQTLYTAGEDVTGECVSRIRHLEEEELSWTGEESEIARINAHSGEEIEISPELSKILQGVLSLCRDTDGALDVTLGKLIELWDIGGENERIPGREEIDAILENTGPDRVRLEGERICLEEGASLHLGAVGKGIACDLLAEYLSSLDEVSGAMTVLGASSIVSFGEKPDGSAWKVAITDPRDPEGGYLGILSLTGTQFLSTSGDYEQFFIEDGVRYHHILDPKTGEPARSGLMSVTVLSDSGLGSDGLSTAAFVLGLKDALPVLEAAGAEALFVCEDRSIYMTEGMKEIFTLQKDGYTISG